MEWQPKYSQVPCAHVDGGHYPPLRAPILQDVAKHNVWGNIACTQAGITRSSAAHKCRQQADQLCRTIGPFELKLAIVVHTQSCQRGTETTGNYHVGRIFDDRVFIRESQSRAFNCGVSKCIGQPLELVIADIEC